MFSYDIFHDNSIDGDVPPGQHILIDKLFPHKLIKNILLFSVNLRQEGSVHINLILQRLQFMNMLFGGVDWGLGDEAWLVEKLFDGRTGMLCFGCEFFLFLLLSCWDAGVEFVEFLRLVIQGRLCFELGTFHNRTNRWLFFSDTFFSEELPVQLIMTWLCMYPFAIIAVVFWSLRTV